METSEKKSSGEKNYVSGIKAEGTTTELSLRQVTKQTDMGDEANTEYQAVAKMREEEEKLKKEIEKRTREKKIRNMRAIRIQAMKDFLQKMPPEEEAESEEAAEECEQRTKEMIQAMDDYNRAGCTTDSFTIYEDDGKEVCDVIFTIAIKNKRPENDLRKLNYRILYEISDENITRICGVVNQSLIINEPEANSSEQANEPEASSSGIESLEEIKPSEKEEQVTPKKGDKTPQKGGRTTQKEKRTPWGRTTQEKRLKRNNSKKRPKIICNKILKTETAEDLRKKLDFHRKLRSQLAKKMQPSLSNDGAFSAAPKEDRKKAAARHGRRNEKRAREGEERREVVGRGWKK